MKSFPAIPPLHCFLVVLFMSAGGAESATLNCDLAQYKAQPGLEARVEGDALAVSWNGEKDTELKVVFIIRDGQPTIREMAVRAKGGVWNVLGHDLIPEFRVATGVRRTGHGLDQEHRWDVFWDAPLNQTNEVRNYAASFHADKCEVKSDGARLEISFNGLSMGTFTGRLQFTVYRGSNLLRQEAIAKTEEPSVAYKYNGGLRGFSTSTLGRGYWIDSKNELKTPALGEAETGKLMVIRARNRTASVEGKAGSVSVLPPPHQFFWARELEVNLGYVWYRKDTGSSFSLGVRQGESAEGYNPTWIEKVFALYNAPPGTWQRMGLYFYLSPSPGREAREAVMAYTHNDQYKPLPGYKTMVTHFHFAFTEELMKAGNLDLEPPWIPMLKGLGINIAHIFDFHSDGHPRDPGPIRMKELETYFEVCRRHSTPEFLIIPGEEANAYLGGHYNIMFPKPVYWTHVRGKNQRLSEEDPKYGRIYHAGNAEDVFALMQKENALVWQTHPRTKGSTGFPDQIREKDYLKSDQWLGTAFKALPVDLSQKRLGEIRCFGTLDDLNNWGRPKYMVGEIDTYKEYPEYDLYGDFNVNYVKLDRVPSADDWSPVNRVLRSGDFFVTTGEILARKYGLEGTGNKREFVADLEWTFPLEFVEIVWGDGERVDRKVVPATEMPPFGSHVFRIPFDAAGKKWVRFSAWDSAGNGMFTQPVHLR